MSHLNLCLPMHRSTRWSRWREGWLRHGHLRRRYKHVADRTIRDRCKLARALWCSDDRWLYLILQIVLRFTLNRLRRHRLDSHWRLTLCVYRLGGLGRWHRTLIRHRLSDRHWLRLGLWHDRVNPLSLYQHLVMAG